MISNNIILCVKIIYSPGFVCHFYITVNILELSETFPEKKSLLIGLTNSLFDASGKFDQRCPLIFRLKLKHDINSV